MAFLADITLISVHCRRGIEYSLRSGSLRNGQTLPLRLWAQNLDRDRWFCCEQLAHQIPKRFAPRSSDCEETQETVHCFRTPVSTRSLCRESRHNSTRVCR